MRHIVSFFAFCLAFLFFIPCVSAQDKTQLKDSLNRIIPQLEGKDKLKAYTHLSHLYLEEVTAGRNIDTLLTLFDTIEAEAIRQGDVVQQGLAYGNTIIAFRNMLKHDEVIRRIPAALDFYIKNKLWKYYYQTHMYLVDSYNQIEDYEKAAAEAEKMYNMAREQKDDGGMATALYATANIYNVQDRLSDQERCLRECIALLQKTPGYYNILVQAYAFLCGSLRAQERYDEIPPVISEFEKAILQFEKVSGATQNAARTNLNIALMYNSIEAKKYDQAKIHLEKVKSLSESPISDIEMNIAQAMILQGLKEYARALVHIDKAIAISHDVRHDFMVEKRIKMEILVQMGRMDEAFKLFDEIIETDRALHDAEVNARFDELRTQYELDKAEQRILLRERTIIVVCGIALLLSITLGLILYLYRKRQIAYRELVQKNLQWAGEGEVPDTDSDEVPDADNDEKNDKPATPSTMDLTIMDDIRTRMTRDKIYTRSDLTMDYFAQELGVSVAYISAAVNRCEQKRFNVYINEFRVKEAIHLLSQQASAGKSADEIAEMAGFNDRKSFHRVFKKMTGLSPTDFRRNLQKKG